MLYQKSKFNCVPKTNQVSNQNFPARLKRVARNIARNIAAVESRPSSATLRVTNFFVYPPSAAFRAIV